MPTTRPGSTLAHLLRAATALAAAAAVVVASVGLAGPVHAGDAPSRRPAWLATSATLAQATLATHEARAAVEDRRRRKDFDRDGNGNIDADRVDAFIDQSIADSASASAFHRRQLAARFDRNRDGMVDRGEFEDLWWSQPGTMTRAELIQWSLAVFDVGRRGFVDEFEFRFAMRILLTMGELPASSTAGWSIPYACDVSTLKF